MRNIMSPVKEFVGHTKGMSSSYTCLHRICGVKFKWSSMAMDFFFFLWKLAKDFWIMLLSLFGILSVMAKQMHVNLVVGEEPGY